MLNTLYRYQTRRAEDDMEFGFTLIELLIVIVVLGILAAVTVFALSGVSGTSAVSACNSDASAVNTAVVAYEAGNNQTAPTAISALTASGNGGPYLQTAPATTHYNISLSGTGAVLVGPKGATAGTQTWTPANTAACSQAT